MFCKNCGNKLEENITICPLCGTENKEANESISNSEVLIEKEENKQSQETNIENKQVENKDTIESNNIINDNTTTQKIEIEEGTKVLKCKKCGNQISGSGICVFCGTPNEIIQNENNNQNMNGNTTTNNNSLGFDEELLKEYVGKNYEKIKKGNFSFPAFFLGNIYLLYRKQWLLFLGIIIVTAIISAIAKFIPIVAFAVLIIPVYLGFTFNKNYIDKSIKKVNEIKNINQNKPREELINICKKSGGTSLLAALLLVAFTIVSIIAAVVLVSLTLFASLPAITSTISDSRSEVFNSTTKEILTSTKIGYNMDTIICKYNGQDVKASTIPKGKMLIYYATSEERLSSNIGYSKTEIVNSFSSSYSMKSPWSNADMYGYVLLDKNNNGTVTYSIMLQDINNHGNEDFVTTTSTKESVSTNISKNKSIFDDNNSLKTITSDYVCIIKEST